MNGRASAWSDVDRAAQPARFVAGLDRLRAEPFFVEQKARLLADLELRGGERAVDVGCGTGEDTAELVRAGCAAVGLERSSTMLAEARRRHPELRLVAGDAARLPFAGVRVDVALLELGDLGRADGIMGLAEWGEAAATAGALDAFAAARWRDDVLTAAAGGTLRYTCAYVRAHARVGRGR